MISRRAFLASSVAFCALPVAAQEVVRDLSPPKLGDPVAFTPDTPVEMARALAARPYDPRPTVPQEWLDLVYDEYRLFWFNTQRALWRDETAEVGSHPPLQVDFFLPGLDFPRGVEIDVVKDGQARHVLFDLGLFDRTDMAPDLPIDETLDYSGFRLRAELEQLGIHQEFVVFQGASYFRSMGRDQVYGLSARGLALNTADEPGEEFPDFTHFWIEEPENRDGPFILHALLDSPSTTGAYRFAIKRMGNGETEMDVTATLFPRMDLTHAGLAPLTSMFLFDQTNRHRFNDFRPAVHDSEGLAVLNGNGEYLWRPLANPVSLQVSAFGDNNPKGFGLIQRARAFGDFADLEALYHQRPSLWITPGEDWGPGAVTLVEIPADKEIYDNIVAYWRPAEPIPAGSEHSFSYHMSWGRGPEPNHSIARVLNSSMGERPFSDGILTVIDFEPTEEMQERMEDFTMVVTSSNDAILGALIQTNPETGGPRLAFTFDPGEERWVELRAQLYLDNRPCTEVWLYRWTI